MRIQVYGGGEETFKDPCAAHSWIMLVLPILYYIFFISKCDPTFISYMFCY